jgi:membrane fusion protein, heavy metal efflux system
MKNYIILGLSVLMFFACSKSSHNHDEDDHGGGPSNDGQGHSHDGGHSHNGGHSHGVPNIKSIRFTEFSESYEIFTEMTPLIVGYESEFVVHFSRMSDYTPITNGSLLIQLRGAFNEDVTDDSIARKGIFITSFVPQTSGDVDIAFIYQSSEGNDTIRVAKQKCYETIAAARKDEFLEKEGITFLKEEAWLIDFGLLQIEPGVFSEVLKTTARLDLHPSGETNLTATTSGIVKFATDDLIIGKKISKGSLVFQIEAGTIREDNLHLKFEQIKSNYERAEKEYERVSELYKLKISPEREYLQTKANYENTRALYENYSQTSDGSAVLIKSPSSGMITELFVNNGQFVEAGSQLARISNTSKMIATVEIPFSIYKNFAFQSLGHFIINDSAYTLTELNGRLLGNPISTEKSNSYVNLSFEIENKHRLIRNEILDVYLFGKESNNAVVIPKAAIWEDQGHYYVFAQIHGELYEKREIKLGAFDGRNYLVEKGLSPGEVIVSEGVYRVMLASKVSNLPSTSHVH